MDKFSVLLLDKVDPVAAEILQAAQITSFAAGAGFKEPQKLGEFLTKTNQVEELQAICLRSGTNLNADIMPLLRQLGLTVIVRCGSGVDNIDITSAAENGIIVLNTPGQNANAVAELVIADMIALSRRLGFANLKLKFGEKLAKSDCKGVEIDGRTLGVIGLGWIGSLVARKALTLGMKVIGYDSDPSKEVDKVKAVDLPELFAQSDYITIHVPLIEDGNGKTRGLIGANQMALIKKKPYLLNCARAGIVELSAVQSALETGVISGYASDVDDPAHPLFALPDTIITPHIGAGTDESELRCAKMGARQLISWLKKGNIVNGVNFPDASLEGRGKNGQLTVIHLDQPKLIEALSGYFGARNINIGPFVTAPRHGFACTMMGPDEPFDKTMVEDLSRIPGVIRVIPYQ